MDRIILVFLLVVAVFVGLAVVLLIRSPALQPVVPPVVPGGVPAPAVLPAAPPPPAPAIPAKAPEPSEELLSLVRPPRDRQESDGIAVALLMDTSGSMKDPVRDTDGAQRPKIDVAKRACRKTIEDLKAFQGKNPDRKLQVGLYQFSGNLCQRILPLGAFQPEEALKAVDRMSPGQGTPIGEAILMAKHDLDRSGLTKKHMVLISDGENTTGRDPVLAARAIAALPIEDQAGIHFIAFQVEAAKFDGIKDAGGTVLEATSPAELEKGMDFILYRKILLEMPEVPQKLEK